MGLIQIYSIIAEPDLCSTQPCVGADDAVTCSAQSGAFTCSCLDPALAYETTRGCEPVEGDPVDPDGPGCPTNQEVCKYLLSHQASVVNCL